MTAALRVDFLTLFPGMLSGYLQESMVGRAIENGLLEVGIHQLRDYSEGKYRVTDDRPFGGGAGMVLKPEPVFKAVETLRRERTTVIYLAPDGEPLSTPLAKELATQGHLLLLSGHYEGLDQRVRDVLVHREISIGDYVLTNGTLAGMVVLDAVARHIPGVLGEAQSLEQDSFSDGLLTFPQWTRPAEFRGMKVPEVLLGGNHAEIEKWRQAQRLERTRKLRPDLLKPNHFQTKHPS